ncbi:complement C3-like isoform X1 [Mobula birostris]|uniref:complement C3-like isoform X1 n=1 Tax=Mobula birostris TaxID=1983395 RepID=UPI003B27C105
MRPLMILLACWLPAVTEQKPSYLITTPSVVHVGLDTTITLQVFESSTDVTVTIYFEQPLGEAVVPRTFSGKHSVELSRRNNFTEMIHAQILPGETAHLNFNHGAQYTTLVAELSPPFSETRKAPIRLRSRPYFIYIVTDKPIYAPNETVHYQTFTFDQEMKPINCTVDIEVLDSMGSVLSTLEGQSESSSVHSGEISSESEMNGMYQIRAKVSKNSEYYGLKKFLVQKHEVPRFGVQIIPDYWYYVTSSDTFPFSIQVENKTDGVLDAMVIFGLTKPSGTRVCLPRLDQHLQMRQGRANVTLRTREFWRNFLKVGKPDEFIGSTLYIEAKVSDNKHKEKKHLDNIPFRLSHYNISFASMKPYFTPGAPFRVPISVTYPNGSPVQNISVLMEVSILEEAIIKESIEGQTDMLGEITFSFTTPVDVLSMNITARVGNTPTNAAKKHAAVKRHQTARRRYLHIKVPNALLYPEDIITVNLTAPGLLDTDHVHFYNYMVLGKGRMLDFQRIERRPETSFQLTITQPMVPYFRIVAYYLLQNGQREIIADSVRVEVESLCDTKFQILSVEYEEGPDPQLLLSALSYSPAEMFVLATDVSLKTLHVDDSISPRMVFEDLDSTDIGLSSGSGNNTSSVFRDSGLFFFSDLMKPPSESPINQPKGMWELPPRNGRGHGLVTIRWRSTEAHRGDADSVQPTCDGCSMWRVDVNTGNNTFRLVPDMHPPESWEVQALSISEKDGLCLARHVLVQRENMVPIQSCTNAGECDKPRGIHLR